MKKLFAILLLVGVASTPITSAPRSMTLNEAIQKSLQTTYAKNAELMKHIAQLDRQLIQRIYDPSLTLHGTHLSDLSEKGNAFSPDITATALGATVQKNFTTGTKVELDTTLSHEIQDFQTFSDVNYKQAFMTLNLEQDLWQNAFGHQDRTLLLQQDLAQEIRLLEISDALEETVYQATIGFWEVIYTEKSMETARQTLENAKRIYELNVRKKTTGLSEERVVLAFKANWQQRQLAYEASVNTYENAKDSFQTALELTEMPKLDENVDKLLALVGGSEFTYNWDEQQASLRRYRISELALKNQALSVKIALDKVKPRFLVFGSAGFNGIDSSLQEAANEMVGFSNLKAQAGFQLRFSGGKSPRYALERAELEKHIQENSQGILKQKIQLEMKAATRTVQLLKSNLSTSLAMVDTLKRKHEEDQRQYDAGRIDVDELLQSEDRFLAAKLAALKSKYEYLQAVGYYYRVNNTLLQKIQVLDGALKGLTL